MNVPSYEEFELLKREHEELRELVRYLLACQPNWLTVNQTLTALRCSRTTLHRLTKAGKLRPRYEGKKPLYESLQVRSYIEATRVSSESATNRVAMALQDKTRRMLTDQD